MKKKIQNITGILTLIYIVIIIGDLVDLGNKISIMDILSFTFFVVFIFGVICMFDYPLITGIIFLVWVGLRLLSEKLSTGEDSSYEVVTIIFCLALIIIGPIFIFLWWDKINKI